jgi:hypothetical protein
MKQAALVALVAIVLTCFGGRSPASATGDGAYSTVRFANTTPWCVWLTIGDGEVPSDQGNFKLQWTNVKAVTVHPNTVYVFAPTSGQAAQMHNLSLQVELYSKGDCTGPIVLKRKIEKKATFPKDNVWLLFGAEAQLDHPGAISNPVFNFYFGADKLISSTKPTY